MSPAANGGDDGGGEKQGETSMKENPENEASRIHKMRTRRQPIKRAEFDALPPTRRVEFLKFGGEITD